MRSTLDARITALLSAACATAAACAAPQLAVQWLVEYGGPGVVADDECSFVGEALDGTLIVVGEAGMSGFDKDLFVARYTNAGALLSFETWDSPTLGNDYVGATAIGDDGSIVVVGYHYGGPGGTTMHCTKWSAVGDLLWSRTHWLFTGGTGVNQLYGAAIDGAGDIVACGSAGLNAGNAVIVKFAGDVGTVLWTRSYDYSPPPVWDVCRKVVIDSNDNSVTVGDSGGNQGDIVIWKHAPDGTLLWSQLVQVGAGWSEIAADVAVWSDDSITVVGYGDGGAGQQHLIARFDADGNSIHEQVLGDSGENRLFRVVLDADGKALVGGEILTPDHGHDFIVRKFDLDGTLLWTRTYGDPIDADDTIEHLFLKNGTITAVGRSGQLLEGGVAGKGEPEIEEGFRFVAWNADDGDLLWQSFDSAGEDHPFYGASSLSDGRFAVWGNFYPGDPEGTNLWFGVWAPAFDCNHNRIPDATDIANGTLHDLDGDDVPDECAALGDLNGDGGIDGDDLGTLLGDWGECAGCPADLNGDGVVDGDDLGGLLGNWS